MSASNDHINNVPDVNNPDKQLADTDLVDKIRIIAKHLTDKQRVVFTLRDLQDFEIYEIADILQMSTGAVKSNLHLARKTIRNELEKSYM